METSKKIKLYRHLTNSACRKHLTILRNHPGEFVLDIAAAYQVQPDGLRRVLNLLSQLGIADWIGQKYGSMPVPTIPDKITFEVTI